MTHSELRDWLVAFVADVLEIGPTEVDRDFTWDELGIDSASMLVLLANLEETTGLRVKPVEVLDHPTIDALADHVAMTAGAR